MFTIGNQNKTPWQTFKSESNRDRKGLPSRKEFLGFYQDERWQWVRDQNPNIADTEIETPESCFCREIQAPCLQGQPGHRTNPSEQSVFSDVSCRDFLYFGEIVLGNNNVSGKDEHWAENLPKSFQNPGPSRNGREGALRPRNWMARFACLAVFVGMTLPSGRAHLEQPVAASQSSHIIILFPCSVVFFPIFSPSHSLPLSCSSSSLSALSQKTEGTPFRQQEATGWVWQVTTCLLDQEDGTLHAWGCRKEQPNCCT